MVGNFVPREVLAKQLPFWHRITRQILDASRGDISRASGRLLSQFTCISAGRRCAILHNSSSPRFPEFSQFIQLSITPAHPP